MGEFALVMLIVFSAVWGSVFLGAYVKRLSRDHDARPDDVLLRGLREDTHQLEARLSRVEEELEFFRELHSPESPAQLPPTPADDS